MGQHKIPCVDWKAHRPNRRLDSAHHFGWAAFTRAKPNRQPARWKMPRYNVGGQTHGRTRLPSRAARVARVAGTGKPVQSGQKSSCGRSLPFAMIERRAGLQYPPKPALDLWPVNRSVEGHRSHCARSIETTFALTCDRERVPVAPCRVRRADAVAVRSVALCGWTTRGDPSCRSNLRPAAGRVPSVSIPRSLTSNLGLFDAICYARTTFADSAGETGLANLFDSACWICSIVRNHVPA